MKHIFAIALLVGCIAAAPNSPEADLHAALKLSNDPKFNDYVARFNKNLTNAQSYQMRLEQYHEADNIIKANNRASKLSGDPRALIMAHNPTSDWTREEYLATLTLDKEAANAKAVSLDGVANGARRLEATATGVDHAADGHMIPVKDQGICGSCWAFSATTALEGTIAKKTGTAPVRHSEQQLVDCTVGTEANMNQFDLPDYTWGCEGGWMETAWTFLIQEGYMTYEDYPYESGDNSLEGQCRHDSSKTIGKVSSFGQILGNQTTDAIKEKLIEQPMTIAIDASSSAFQYYSSGVIGPNDNCGTTLNHAVTLVGFTDSGVRPPPPPPQVCKVRKWWYTCREMTDEELAEYEAEQAAEDDPDAARRLQDTDGNDVYWKFQNSWDSSWGDNGFGLVYISEGLGVCGVNQVAEWVDFVQN